MDEIPEKRKLEDVETDTSGVAKKQATADNKGTFSDSEPNVPPITVNMSCPQVKVGPLIGKKGVVIQEIMRQSGCKIQIDQNYPEGVPRQIQLTGTPKALSLAMQLISQVLENVDANGNVASGPLLPQLAQPPPPPPSEDDYMCPHDKVGSVIGQKGANINEIMRRTGCKIQILQDGIPDGVDRRMQFIGTSTQVAEAKALVAAIISDGASALQPVATALANGLSVVEEDISPDKVRIVIGQKGATITLISKQSGCKILMNQKFPPGQPHKIIYTGTTQQIEIAKYMVETVINHGQAALLSATSSSSAESTTVMQEMNVFQSQMVRLLGPHGSNVSDVQVRCGVKINIDTTPVMLVGNTIGPSGFAEATNKVTVIGSSERVQHAVKMLYEFIGIIVAAPPTPPMPYMTHNGMGGVNYNVPVPTYGGPSSQQIVPPVNNVGYVPVQMQSNPHMMQQHQPPMQGAYMPGYPVLSPPVPMVNPVLALGEDGTSGTLEGALQLPDGNYQQIAEIKNHALTRFTGKQSMNILLIMSKSGANVQVMKADPVKGSSKVFLTASSSQALSLAAQMVQEVLVNGIGKLQTMPDAIAVAPSMPVNGIPAASGFYPGIPMQPMVRPPMMYQPPPAMPFIPHQQQQQQMYGGQPQFRAPPPQSMYGGNSVNGNAKRF